MVGKGGNNPPEVAAPLRIPKAPIAPRLDGLDLDHLTEGRSVGEATPLVDRLARCPEDGAVRLGAVLPVLKVSEEDENVGLVLISIDPLGDRRESSTPSDMKLARDLVTARDMLNL